MRLHVAVQEVVRTIAAGDGEPVSLAQAERMLDQAMANCGFGEDEASAEYRSIAAELVSSLITQTSEVELVENGIQTGRNFWWQCIGDARSEDPPGRRRDGNTQDSHGPRSQQSERLVGSRAAANYRQVGVMRSRTIASR